MKKTYGNSAELGQPIRLSRRQLSVWRSGNSSWVSRRGWRKARHRPREPVLEQVGIRGRLFPVEAPRSAEMSFGGFQSELRENGDGSARLTKIRVPYQVRAILAVDATRADWAFLRITSDCMDFLAVTLEMSDGVTYAGRGMLTGELILDKKKQTVEVEIQGPELVKTEPRNALPLTPWIPFTLSDERLRAWRTRPAHT